MQDRCETTTAQIDWHCDVHYGPFDCPDAPILYSDRLRAIIHDGGRSRIDIEF